MSDIQPPLSRLDVLSLAKILQSFGKGVTWIKNGQEMRGTSRHIVKGSDDFTFLSMPTDIREGHLRITLTSGFDTTIPVTEAMRLVESRNLIFEK